MKEEERGGKRRKEEERGGKKRKEEERRGKRRKEEERGTSTSENASIVRTPFDLFNYISF